MTETGADTGIFKGTFGVVGAATTAADQVLAVAGQNITVKYTDADPAGTRTAIVTVEATKPQGVVVEPADGAETTSLTAKLIVDFTDVQSLVNAFSITISIVAATSSVGAEPSVTVATISTTAITNGFRGEVALASVPADRTTLIAWTATASDNAGNTGTIDSDGATAGNQHFTLIVDKQSPDFAGGAAFAGTWFDTTNNVVVTDATNSKDTSIGIKIADVISSLSVEESLNAGTVTAADFEIDNLKKADGTTVSDLTPTAATVYSKAKNWIFLTVPAMAPNAAPDIKLLTTSGGISDTAGNATTATATITTPASRDKQAPSITATLSTTLTQSSAILTVTTNEPGGVPVVTFNQNGSITKTTVVPTLVATNTYEANISPPGDGAFGIGVSVTDANGNTSTLGSSSPTVGFPESTDIALYVDAALPSPVILPANGATVSNASPFVVTIDYAGEGLEYGLAAGGLTTATVADIVTDLDVHNTVTISAVTLDGTDKSISLSTADNILFTLSLPVVGEGAHTLSVTGVDLAGNANVAISTFTVSGAPPANTDLSITKSASPSTVTADQPLTYTLTVTNNGPSSATGVTVTDTLPSGVVFVGASATQGSCGQSSGTVTCDLGTLANTVGATITITVRAPSTPQTLTNIASVAAAEPDGVPSNDSATVNTVVAAGANVAITKSADLTTVNFNQPLTYTLVVSNGGPNAATGVTLTDNLPSGVSFVSATPTQGSCGEAGGTVTCNLGTIENGASATVSIVVTTPGSPQTINNSASVTAVENDVAMGNNSDSVSTVIAQSADLSITKSGSPNPVIIGQALTYTLTVTNHSADTANNITVSDTLPSGVTFVSASSGCSESSGVVTCTIASLSGNTSTQLTITVTAPLLGGTVTNTATVTSASPADPDSANNTTTVITSVAVPPGVPSVGTWGLLGLGAVLAFGVLLRRRRLSSAS